MTRSTDAVIVVVLLLAASCGGSGGATRTSTATATAEAARASAGERSFPSQGNDHLADAAAPHPAYNSNPPTSGWHLPALARPGVYGQPLRAEDLPHFMEHGGVWLLYNCPTGCDADVNALRTLANAAIEQMQPVALAPFQGMETKFAVVAWQRLLTLASVDRPAIVGFVGRYACAYNPEGGPFCSDGRGAIGPTSGTPTPIAPTR